MSATAASQSPADVVPFSPQTIETVDYLASLFIELKRTASQRYRDAYLADEPHEQLKSRLIMMVSEIGRDAADGSKILSGRNYEMRLALGAGSYCDPDAVTAFRYALIRHKVPKVPDIFQGQVLYRFREQAKRIIDGLNLPDKLLA